MTTNPKQIYYVPINPNKKKIILNMTLHATFVLTFQQMGTVFFWYRQVIYKQIGNIFKSFHLFRKVSDALEVFFELTCRV